MNDDRLAELERVRPGDPDARHPATTSSHVFDLSAHEQRRLSAVLAATPDIDPGAVLAAEVEAHRMLYSGLDAEQQAVFRMLVDAGILDA
jgi:hypothetical protein